MMMIMRQISRGSGPEVCGVIGNSQLSVDKWESESKGAERSVLGPRSLVLGRLQQAMKRRKTLKKRHRITSAICGQDER